MRQPYITILRKSPFTGNVNQMDIPMSAMDFALAEERWENGVLIQDAFPNLNADQREFIKTGITPEEWAETFGEEK